MVIYDTDCKTPAQLSAYGLLWQMKSLGQHLPIYEHWRTKLGRNIQRVYIVGDILQQHPELQEKMCYELRRLASVIQKKIESTVEEPRASPALFNALSSDLADNIADTTPADTTPAAVDSELSHTYIGQVAVLSPTLGQYQNFPTFLCQAHALGVHNSGAVLVNCPPNQHQELRSPLPTFKSQQCLRYQVQQREEGVFEIAGIFCEDTITPTSCYV
ncbi:hypothetical protein MMC07_007017 [Pseudocyphellaria aurata]|nr:hypothetical protein [Pseudocyphellaria aurata]